MRKMPGGADSIMSKQKPRFFCDNCSYEVGSEVKICPYCGRHFASIRCPACDYSGPDRMFQNGCPMCGYSAPSAPRQPKQKKVKSHPKREAPPAEPLPFWTYVITFIFLFFVIALLSWFITR
ncbi:MAG: zinc ribbon domain-containing protein [Treponema sp.]|nr:zinc ribbon domain-containing protein [Treponema sp.]